MSSGIRFLVSITVFCLLLLFILSLSLLHLHSSSSSYTDPFPFRSRATWLPRLQQRRASTATATAAITTLVLPTARPPPSAVGPTTTNVSHLLFGLGGSAKTWYNRHLYSSLWWVPGTTRGFVWLDCQPPSNFTWPVDTSPPFRVSSGPVETGFMDRLLHRSKSSSSRQLTPSQRIAMIVKESFELAERGDYGEVRWFVMGDDDTVFFPENLAGVLSKYDHNKMWYVGGVSESVEQDVMHSYNTAYGGAGFAVSYPLAKELAKVLDGCVERYRSYYGSDEKVAACVCEIGVLLTRELGFHQLDIKDDPYGLLAAHPIAPLVSLHHLDYVKPLFPNRTQLESLAILMGAYRADPARTLQQSFCYDKIRKWSISIAWGYSAQLYPSLLTARELETPLQTFRTWGWNQGPFVFNTHPLGPDHCEQPIAYYLDEVEEVAEGKTLTTYRQGTLSGLANSCNRTYYEDARRIDRILVTAEKLDAQEWMKAPRRQCCELAYGEDNSIIRVILRRCKPGGAMIVWD